MRIANAAGDVAMTGDIFGDQDIAWVQPLFSPVGNLEFSYPRQVHHVLQPGCVVVVRIWPSRAGIECDVSGAHVVDDFGKLLRGQVFKVRFSVAACVDSDYLYHCPAPLLLMLLSLLVSRSLST